MTPGASDEEWVVDVVLRANGHEDRQAEVVTAVRRALPDARKPPEGTSSYDGNPPDGSIGVSCWVSSTSAGTAIDVALDLVCRCAKEVTGEELRVWDVRALPLSAVLETQHSDPSTMSTRLLQHDAELDELPPGRLS